MPIYAIVGSKKRAEKANNRNTIPPIIVTENE